MSAGRTDRRLAALAGTLIGLALGAVGAAPASAGSPAILIRAESITIGAVASPVAFSNGDVVDIRELIIEASALPVAGSDLLIHDLATGATRVADADVEARAVVSIDGGSATTLGVIFRDPGDVVLFETPSPSPVDPLIAERFLVRRAFGGSENYVPPGFMLPEPGFGVGSVVGVIAVAALSTRRSRRES